MINMRLEGICRYNNWPCETNIVVECNETQAPSGGVSADSYAIFVV